MSKPLESYLRHLTIERGLSANTLSAYGKDLSGYLDFLEQEGVDLMDARSEHIEGYQLALIDSGLIASSRARALAAIRGLHRFLALEGIRSDDPTKKVRPPKLPIRLPKALHLSQVEKLLEASGPEPGVDSPDLIRIRNRAIVELLYSSGARVSEIAALDLDEVDHSGFIRVRGKGSKERLVPVGSFARRALEEYLVRVRPGLVKAATPALFLNQRGGRLSRQSIWEIIRACGEAVGIELSPHTLRHCFATHLIEGGADVRVVQELLGHSSVATTQIYTKITIDTLREVYQSAHPRARR
ncbi:site-specific tyrosine recombinase XerD [Aquiluna sp. KACHI24]|uniref:site-specific tyrosine recombinase XerD n=1 Tax=Aquiluna sp. KACHI24 TaxID=2968831 RepID=UPI00220FA56B|nr:site-specific tyrosine recombinase XerD [Aquiluna sp. KACHI24]BDQ00147.1 tyrosine recombinase XerD [Aquiluna sp. KACHI24]